MRTTRSTGFIAVTLTITLLALEAVAVLGLARVASTWTPSRVAALARAGATTWAALTRSAQHAVVIRTLPAALGVVRTTTEMMQAVWPATVIESPGRGMGPDIARTSVPESADETIATRTVAVRAPVANRVAATPRVYVFVHTCSSTKEFTRVVCTTVTRSHSTRKTSRT